MPLVITPDPDKDSAFVRHYVKSKDAVQACGQARIHCFGYDPRDVAYHQLARPEIKQAIAAEEKRVATLPPAEITKDSIITDLERVFDESMQAGEYNPAIAAKKTQASMMGWLEQTVNINLKQDATMLSDAELLKVINDRRPGTMIEGEFTATPAPKQIAGIGRPA